MANGSGRLTELTASELHKKHAQIREAQAAINASAASASSSQMMKAPAELLCCARTLVDRVLAEGVVEFDRLQEHVRALATHALETAQLAVCIELEQLHALLGRWRNDVGERRGLACTSSSAALISHEIARQRASILESFFTSARAPPLNGRIGWSTAKVSATSTRRSTCWRDMLSISGPRIFYSAPGGVFRRIFLPTPPEQKCGNFFRRCAAAQVAHTGAHDKCLQPRCEI